MEFNPLPSFTTPNLILRQIKEEDLNHIHYMRTLPQMIEYVDMKLDNDLNETLVYINRMNKGIMENKWVIWAIEHKSDKKVIGTISVWNFDENKTKAELGYGIIPAYQNFGYMSEALDWIVDAAFNTYRLKSIYAYTEENNKSSIRLLEKAKFIYDSKVNEEGYFKKGILTMLVYRKDNLRSEYNV